MSLAKRYIDALSRGDVAELRVIASEVVNDHNLTVIKCHGCGAVVAWLGEGSLVMGALGGGDPTITYAILKHMETCPIHDVRVPLPGGADAPAAFARMMPSSRGWEKNFRERFAGWVQANDPPLTYDQWFAQYVETKRPIESSEHP